MPTFAVLRGAFNLDVSDISAAVSVASNGIQCSEPEPTCRKEGSGGLHL